MMRKKSLLIFCLLFIFATKAKSYLPPLEIDVVSIEFNYESGYSDDAVGICKNASTTIARPEWLPPSRNNRFAYIKSQSNKHIEVTFSHNQSAGDVEEIEVRASTGGYGPGYISSTCVQFSSSSTSATAELTTTGTTPGSIQDWGFSFYWYVDEVDDIEQDPSMSLGTSGSHDYYTILAAPQSPMTTPWTDVLDYACDWASGYSSTTGAATKIAQGIYDMEDTDGDIDYNYASYYCTDYDELELEDFLDDVSSTNNVKVNCTDCGNLVNVFTAAVGIQSHSKRIWYGIDTNDIDPIGSSYGWGAVSWSYHQYGWFNNLVFDSSLRFDRYGTPRVPTNISQSSYNTLLIDGTPPANSQVYTTQIVN